MESTCIGESDSLSDEKGRKGGGMKGGRVVQESGGEEIRAMSQSTGEEEDIRIGQEGKYKKGIRQEHREKEEKWDK